MNIYKKLIDRKTNVYLEEQYRNLLKSAKEQYDKKEIDFYEYSDMLFSALHGLEDIRKPKANRE